MSYALARAQLVSILTGITPSDTSVYSGRFVHFPEMSGKNPTSRAFWLTANEDGPGVIRGPDILIASGQSPLHVVTMSLTVSYRDHHPRQHEVDINLESDRTDISIALLKQTNWNRPTSGIENLSNGRDFMSCERKRVGPAIEMKFTFPCVYR